MDAFFATTYTLIILLVIRIGLTFKMRMAALDVIAALIDTPEFAVEYDSFEAMSYRSMMFDLRKWTFKQFYPSLAGRI